jgi:hypothetical protein
VSIKNKFKAHFFLAGSNEIEFYYLTDFTDSIAVSLNIGAYAFVRDTALLFKKTIQEASSLTRHKKKTTSMKRVFKCKKFDLSPTLNFLGDSTPDLQKVFRWLGIKNMDYAIPMGTHVGFTDSLEGLLTSFYWISKMLKNVDSLM